MSLSPSTTPAPPCPSSTRTTIGTTITVKDLFANCPVRQASSRSNITAQWAELQKLTVGIGLSRPIAITLRNQSGEKFVILDKREGNEWETKALEKGLGGKCRLFRVIEEKQEEVEITMKLFFASTLRSSTFVCLSP
jgi:DNA mismatch repair ATPase MutL